MHLPSEGGQEEGIGGGGTRGRNLRGGRKKGKGRLIQEHMKYPIFQRIFAFGFFNGKVKFQGQDI